MIAGTPEMFTVDPYSTAYFSIWDDSCMVGPGGSTGERTQPFNTDDMRTFAFRTAARFKQWMGLIDYSAFTDAAGDHTTEDRADNWTRTDECRFMGFYRVANHSWVGVGVVCMGNFGGRSTQNAWHGIISGHDMGAVYSNPDKEWGPVVAVQFEEDGWFASGSATMHVGIAAAGKRWSIRDALSLGIHGELHYATESTPASQRFGEKVENGVYGSAYYMWKHVFLSVSFNPINMRADMQIGARF